jgi:hypothetical protein
MAGLPWEGDPAFCSQERTSNRESEKGGDSGSCRKASEVNRKKREKEKEKMRKELIALLCVGGVLVWGVTLASAQTTVHWTMLQHAGVAAKSAGADGLVGTADDGTDNCNFLPDVSPCNVASPPEGSYNINRLDYKPDPREECMSANKLVTGGTPCKCADGVNTCHPGTDTCPPVSSGCGETPGNCCGVLNCLLCDDMADSYFGAGLLGLGKMDTCMDLTQTKTILFDAATTEDSPGLGGGCLLLFSPGDDTGTPCPNPAAATAVSGSIDVAVGAMGACPRPNGLFQVNNVLYTGSIFPASAPPGSVCGYNGGYLTNLVNRAIADSGVPNPHIMVLCGTTTLPPSGGISQVPCFSNAAVQFTTVAWTTDTWTCSGTCP